MREFVQRLWLGLPPSPAEPLPTNVKTLTINNQQHLLFVCSRNQWRSPTAEKVYSQKGFSARSAGTSPNAKRTISANDIKWSSHIFVMENKHKQRLIARFTQLLAYKKLIVLDIPDEYQYMDTELIDILKDSVEHHL